MTVGEILAGLIALCGGLALLFLFMAAIGSVDPGDATPLAIAVLVFSLIWLAGVWYRRRQGVEPERVNRADRERRGF